MLLADHISTVRQVRDTLQAITPDVDNVHDLIDTVNTMTERVCEVSELLAEPTVTADIDEADIERELNDLIGEPEVIPLLRKACEARPFGEAPRFAALADPPEEAPRFATLVDPPEARFAPPEEAPLEVPQESMAVV